MRVYSSAMFTTAQKAFDHARAVYPDETKFDIETQVVPGVGVRAIVIEK